MLKYFPVGPFEDNRYAVGYLTPAAQIVTVVVIGLSKDSALQEASRLNHKQKEREIAIKADRAARGLCGTYPDLAKSHK